VLRDGADVTCHDAASSQCPDQLTQGIGLAAWFGTFEEPLRMSSDCLRRADDARQRAAQSTEPSIKSAYEKAPSKELTGLPPSNVATDAQRAKKAPRRAQGSGFVGR